MRLKLSFYLVLIHKWEIFENNYFSISNVINPFHPDPGRREKINLNFYFHTSLWCLKGFYEGLKGLFILIQLFEICGAGKVNRKWRWNPPTLHSLYLPLILFINSVYKNMLMLCLTLDHIINIQVIFCQIQRSTDNFLSPIFSLCI